MSYSSGTGGRVQVPVTDGLTIVVNITKVSSGALTVYSDVTRATPVSMPATITTSTIFYVDNGDTYSISLKCSGTECASVNGTVGAAIVDLRNDTSTSIGVDIETALVAGLSIESPLASPALTGVPTAPTPATGDSSTKIATTALVAAKITALGLNTASTYPATAFDAANSATTAQGAAIAAASSDATTKANTAQAAAITAAATDATTKANAAQTAATTAAATDATSKVATETTRATTAEALLAPLASPALTGNPTVPTQAANTSSTRIASTAFVATGFVPTLLSQVGAPTSGTWATGATFIDSNGLVYACTASGTPGTWVLAQPGAELASATFTTSFTMSATSDTDITGLSITFTAPARNFIVRLMIPQMVSGGTTQLPTFTVADPSNTAIGITYGGGTAGGQGGTASMDCELPSTGTGGYAITPGTSYTFKARYRMNSVALGNGTIQSTPGTARPLLRAFIV